MEATLMAGNSTGEEKLTAVLEAKMEMEERYAVVVAESNASLALQREHEETIRSLKADIIREETLEKTRHAKLVSQKDDLQYDLSIVSDKLRIAEGHLEENALEIQALVAKKESIEQLYNEKLQQSGTSDESSRKENLELTNQLRIAHENHQQTLKEAQEEIAELISTVVESKLNAATHATEVDEVKQKMKALKQRLQVYAQRVATLEVAVAEANSVPNSEEDDNSYGFTTAIRRYTGFLK
jgi:chromosome segregation ATPase